MLKIRKEQMKVFDKIMYENDIETISQRLQQKGLFSSLDIENLKQDIELAVTNAMKNGIQDIDDVVEYLYLYFTKGEEFFNQPHIQEIINRKGADGNVKMALVQSALTTE